jgi:hypothetical protein
MSSAFRGPATVLVAVFVLAGCGGSNNKAQVSSAHTVQVLLMDRWTDGAENGNVWPCFKATPQGEATTKEWWTAEAPLIGSNGSATDAQYQKRERLESQHWFYLQGGDKVEVSDTDGPMVKLRIVSQLGDEDTSEVGKSCFTVDDGNLFDD